MSLSAISARALAAAAFPRFDQGDERIWSGSGIMGAAVSGSGVVVDHRSALQVSCFYHGVRLYAETIGTLPLKLYRKGDDGSREEQRDNELWSTLHDQPNPWQTAQQFRGMMTAWAKLHGTAVARKVEGDNGVELWPIDPELVTSDFQPKTGRLRFHVNHSGGDKETLLQDEVFRLEGFGVCPTAPSSLVAHAREAIGHWLAVEQYGSKFFSQGAKPSMIAEHPTNLSPEAALRIRGDIERASSGLANMHRWVVLEDGMTAKPVGFNAEESQFNETREALVAECARWLNLPQHMLKSTLSTTTYASVSEFSRETIDYSWQPVAVAWEQSIKRDLLDEDDDAGVYAEHVFDSLLRGHAKDRYETYAIAVQNGIMSRNEVRAKENLDPLPGKHMEEPQASVNVAPTAPSGVAENGAEAALVVSTEPSVIALPKGVPGIVRGVASRLARREHGEVSKAYKRDATTAPEWADAWYSSFSGEISEALQLAPCVAQDYTDGRKTALLELGPTEEWKAAAEDRLVALALEE